MYLARRPSRLLTGKSNSKVKKTGIGEINSSISGELKPIRPRRDLNAKGVAQIKGNKINKG